MRARPIQRYIWVLSRVIGLELWALTRLITIKRPELGDLPLDLLKKSRKRCQPDQACDLGGRRSSRWCSECRVGFKCQMNEMWLVEIRNMDSVQWGLSWRAACSLLSIEWHVITTARLPCLVWAYARHCPFKLLYRRRIKNLQKRGLNTFRSDALERRLQGFTALTWTLLADLQHCAQEGVWEALIQK